MKKFLTVLLVIAVMFTFSFSSAFATINWVGESTSKYLTEKTDYLAPTKAVKAKKVLQKLSELSLQARLRMS